MHHVQQLSNGIKMPMIGLGTFRAEGDQVKLAVRTALDAGIRHVDTASIYKNEVEIGLAIKESGISRQEIFITSKVSPYEQGQAKASAACQAILQRLDCGYVDLVLVHWPGVAKVKPESPDNARQRWETWQVLEQYYQAGMFRAIGVSNYEQGHLEELCALASVKPAVNQFEVHPRRQCRELRAACKAADVAVVAYASLGCGDLIKHPVVQQVAAEASKTPAQVLLRWGIQSGFAVLPKSVHPEYIQQYAPDKLLNWELTGAQLKRLDQLEDGHKYCWDPAGIV